MDFEKSVLQTSYSIGFFVLSQPSSPAVSNREKKMEDMRKKGVSPLYLVTDHTGFYERYGWEFYCMAQGDGEPDQTRLYIHK